MLCIIIIVIDALFGLGKKGVLIDNVWEKITFCWRVIDKVDIFGLWLCRWREYVEVKRRWEIVLLAGQDIQVGICKIGWIRKIGLKRVLGLYCVVGLTRWVISIVRKVVGDIVFHERVGVDGIVVRESYAIGKVIGCLMGGWNDLITRTMERLCQSILKTK